MQTKSASDETINVNRKMATTEFRVHGGDVEVQ